MSQKTENTCAMTALEVQIEAIEQSHTYHSPKPGQPELYAELRDAAKQLAILIATKTPRSREQSTALTKVEEAIMWANKGVALHGK